MEGITVDTCSLDGSRQTSYIQLLSLANPDLLSLQQSSNNGQTVTPNLLPGPKPTIRIQPASFVVQNSNNSSKKTFAIPSNSNSSGLSRFNFEATRTSETLLCAYDNQQKTLTVLGSTNFGRNISVLPRNSLEDNDRNETTTNVTEDNPPNVATSKISSSKKCRPRFKGGGWPKGKKRRKSHPSVKTPKSPSTAYNLFCNQRRAVVKLENPDMPLSEIMKILGKEWSTLAKPDKQKYHDVAEKDMERYKKELSVYKTSAEYQEFLNNKKQQQCSINALSGDFLTPAVVPDGPGTSYGHPSAVVSMDNDNDDMSLTNDNDLYCKDCDVYFHHLHNKLEHMKGKEHRKHNIRKFEDYWTSKTNLQKRCSKWNKNAFNKQALNMEELMVNVYEKNRDDELEFEALQTKVEHLKEKNDEFRSISNAYVLNLSRLQDNLKYIGSKKISLQQKLTTLTSVPKLFETEPDLFCSTSLVTTTIH